jgi:hypothetical protein
LDFILAQEVLDFFEDLKEREWDPMKFVDFATKYANQISLYHSYLIGELSFEKYSEKVKTLGPFIIYTKHGGLAKKYE